MKLIAEQLAKIHCLRDLPLKKTSVQDNLNRIKGFAASFDDAKKQIHDHPMIQSLDSDTRTIIGNFDLWSEIEWLDQLLKRSKFRTTFALLDMNYLNCIIRDQECSSGSKIVFIDYDACQYNNRGVDFASHFFGRVLNAGGKEKIRHGAKFPGRSDMIQFFEHYQRALQNSGLLEDFDENGTDSIDQLIIETKIGMCQSVLSFLGMTITQHDKFWVEGPHNFFPVSMMGLKVYLEYKYDLSQPMS